LASTTFSPRKSLEIELRPGNKLESVPAYPGEKADAEDYALYTRRLWDDQDDALRPLHDIWTQNLLFLSGRQWWEQLPTGEWRPQNVPEWREQPVSNISLAYFKTFLAKTTKTRPAWQTVPASSDPEDVQAASLADQVLESIWMKLRLSRQLRRAVAWTISTGNAFMLPYWNTETGKMTALTEEIEVPVYDEMTGEEVGKEMVQCPCDEKGEPYKTPDGRPDLTKEPAMLDEGEVGVKVYSPFQVRVNPTAECEEDVTWAIIAEVIPVDELKERYPDKADLIRDDDIGNLADYDRMISAIAGGADTMLSVSSDRARSDDMPRALVLHYHEKPSRAFPDGRFWVICNNDVLLEDPQELPDGIWPAFVHLTDLLVPGRYYAMATLEAIIGLNREYNEINAQVKEHHNLMARGKWVVERGTGIKKGMISTQPGEVLQVNTGFLNGVKQLDVRGLPEPVYRERDRILADWEMVSGIHKASMGSPPPGVTAGVAFLQLQEADDTDLGPFLGMLEESVAQLAGAILQLVKNRYTDDRLIYVAGPNRRYQVKSFRAADIESCVDVIPIAESSMSWSKAARQNMLMEMAKLLPQVFTDADTGMFDTAKFTSLLPLGGLESLAMNDDLDVQEAMREEEMFEAYGTISNELPMVEFWQNHAIHSRTHKRTLKSAKFREWSPEAQEAFKLHVQEHDGALMAAMMPPVDPNAPPGQPPAGGAPAPGNLASAGPAGPPNAEPAEPIDPMMADAPFLA
jgi:hypothetical protein